VLKINFENVDSVDLKKQYIIYFESNNLYQLIHKVHDNFGFIGFYQFLYQYKFVSYDYKESIKQAIKKFDVYVVSLDELKDILYKQYILKIDSAIKNY